MRALLSLAAVLSACGAPAPSIPYPDLEAATHSSQCERLVRCGLFADQPSCEAYFRPLADHDLDAAIKAGKVHYDGAAAKQCQDALALVGCDASQRDVRVLPDACKKVLTGTAKGGAECLLDAECASGDCDLPTCPRDTCCPGSCTASHAPAAIDAACAINADCVADTFCGKDLVCHALATVGKPCDNDTQCEYGLGCIGATDLQTGACRQMPLLGEACPYLRCAEIGARCDAAFTCVPLGLPPATCALDTDCSPYGHCDATLHCADAPALGQACSSPCAGDAFCRFDGQPIGTCVAPGENLTPCNSDLECGSYFCQEGPAFDACADPALCF